MKATLPTLVLLLPLSFAAPAVSDSPPPVADALGALCSAGSAEPVPAAGPCYVKEYCDAGGYVECWGDYPSSTCTAGPEYVECDGDRTECPCQASLTCYGGTVISCTGGGHINQCEVGPHYVNCNEQFTYCPVTCTAACDGGFPSCKGYDGPNACFKKLNLYIQCDDRQYECSGGLE